MSETKRLGRGLEALLGPVSREQAVASGSLRELPVAADFVAAHGSGIET